VRHIASVTADKAEIGKLTTFTVSGGQFPTALTPTVTGCTGLAVIGSTSTTQRLFTCTPSAASVNVSIDIGAPAPFVSAIAAAPAVTAGVPSVSAVISADVAYGKLSTFSVIGSNLPTSVTPSVTGCATLVNVASTSSMTRTFTCTPDGINVPVSVSFGGSAPYTTTISVPLPQVTLVTSLGTVVVELYPDKAPLSVKNFLSYVATNFYDNTIFHRVVAGFVTQGGGFISDTTNKVAAKPPTSAAIALESNNGLSNSKYTLAMARTNLPDSATSQFYFNAANNTSLDFNVTLAAANGYAVFGKAISGTAVLDSMNAVANSTLTTGTFSGLANVPTTALVLQSATRTQ
jgi:cyclophilin family peptidyl-prolyl cis-trans isomerase